MNGRVIHVAAFAMLCAIWGSTWLAIKVGLEGAPPFLSAALRFVIASLILSAAAFLLRRALPRNRGEWTLIVFVGLVLFTADYGLIYWGENNGVESGLSAILFATMPLQTALFAQALLRGERLTVPKVAGILIGFGGILVIFRGQLTTAGPEKFFPMLAIVLSATCAAVSTVAIKRWGHDLDPVAFNAGAMGVGAVSLAAVSLVAGEPWAVPSWPAGLGAILYLALLGSVIAFVVYLRLLKTFEATAMSYVALITPIVAVFLGFSLGNEILDPIALAGAAVTLAGIYISTSKRASALLRPRTAGVPVNPPNGK